MALRRNGSNLGCILGHRKVRHFLQGNNPTVRRVSSTAETSSEGRHSLPPMTALVVIERMPVVIPKPPDWFLLYQEFSFERRQGNRKQYPPDFLSKAAEPPSDDTRPPESATDGQADVTTSSSVLTFFDHPSRRTQADKANDVRSLQRCLDQSLYLLVKGPALGKPASGTSPAEWRRVRWRFPELAYGAEESMRQCAEGAVSTLLSAMPPEVYFVGNAPCAHLEEGQAPPPEASTAAADGEASAHGSGQPAPVDHPLKRFFFWARWVSPDANPTIGAGVQDYAWLTKEEVLQHLDEGGERTLAAKLLPDSW